MDSQQEDLSLPGGKCPFSPCLLPCALSKGQTLREELLHGLEGVARMGEC